MPAKPRLLKLSDHELLDLIKEDPDYLSIVYKETKDYCLAFMRKMVIESAVREEELNDIFQDSVIVLYEKIRDGEFELTSSFQTYLNSVCRFQLLKRFRKKSFFLADNMDGRERMHFDPEIKDELKELAIEQDSQFLALEKALRSMRKAGGKCYEILSLFWYHQKSIQEIAEHFGYTNEANAKNQKAKCQKRLRKMALRELNVY